MTKPVFSQQVLDWFDENGRHDLPWQQDKSLYRIWIAEIMLQQTQVTTVIPYYQRFMEAFPTLESIVQSTLDQVLALWAGLGYYRRARNLHKAALQIANEHQGEFPEDFEAILALPGIGRSTAGAILAQALDQRFVILDGNVKRVLARYHAIDAWTGHAKVEKVLWMYADQHTPENRVADYTQAMMDMGATLCRRTSPGCEICPIHVDCQACQQGRQYELPVRRPKKKLPLKTARFMILRDETTGAIYLEKRPPTGIWGGLWSLPEAPVDDLAKTVCCNRWGIKVEKAEDLVSFRHTFSHYHLDITPCLVTVSDSDLQVQDSANSRWCQPSEYEALAMASPVTRILKQLRNDPSGIT